MPCHVADSRNRDPRGHNVLRDLCLGTDSVERPPEHIKHSFETPARPCLSSKKACPKLGPYSRTKGKTQNISSWLSQIKKIGITINLTAHQNKM